MVLRLLFSGARQFYFHPASHCTNLTMAHCFVPISAVYETINSLVAKCHQISVKHHRPDVKKDPVLSFRQCLFY